MQVCMYVQVYVCKYVCGCVYNIILNIHIHIEWQIQELKGGGAEVKYVCVQKFNPWPCPLWCIKGYGKLGGGKLGEA